MNVRLYILSSEIGRPCNQGCWGCMSATGIAKARYCNPVCQKAHWKAHKPHCGGRKACQCGACVSARNESSSASSA